jgi:hypothetical protein
MMPNKAISVSLAKIDYDLGKPYIKIIADCPYDHTFVGFFISVLIPTNTDWEEYRYDASMAVAGRKKLIAPYFPVSALPDVNDRPAIYQIRLIAEDSTGLQIIDDLVLSDVHYIYRYLLDSLLNESTCTEISDDMLQKYLILYGHEKALQAGDIDVAKELFKVMHKGFKKCGSFERSNINCGCHDRCR